jgi:exonuclease SbcC
MRLELEADIREAEGQLKGVKEALLREKQRQKALAKKVEIEERRTSYRGMLQEAKDVLHRENLPAAVARRFLSSINGALQEKLKSFDLDFTAWLDQELDPVFKSEDTPEPKSALFLSGGQKSILSICFSVALWELFLPHMGVLVLDEPTVWLDEDRIEDLIEFLQLIRAYCNETNKQIIVVSHNKALCSAFDRTIDVGALYE